MMKSLVIIAAMLGIMATQAVAEEEFLNYAQMEKAELGQVLLQLRKEYIALKASDQEYERAFQEAAKTYSEASAEDKTIAFFRMVEAESMKHLMPRLGREIQRAKSAYKLVLDREHLRKIASNLPSTVNAPEPTPKPSTQWEYKVRTLTDLDIGSVEGLETELNTFGNNRWELVTLSSDIVILKRQKLGNTSSIERK